MNVGDLIKELSKYSENLEVVGYSTRYNYPTCVYVGTSHCTDEGWAEENDSNSKKVVTIEISN